MGTINYSGRMPNFSIGSTTIQNPNTGQTTTFNPSGGISLHNPGSRYGTFSGTTGDGTTYLGNPQSTITSTGEVYHGSSAPWQIQGQHSQRQAPLSGGTAPQGDSILAQIARDEAKKQEKPKKKEKKKQKTMEEWNQYWRERLKDAPKGPDPRAKGNYKPHTAAEWQAFKKANPGVGVKEFVKLRKADPANYYNYGGGVMAMPDYTIRNAPMLQQKKGPLEALTDFGKSKALSAGLEAAFPGGGIAAEAAQEVIPTFFQAGGPIGGGQTKEGLMEARQLGALSQKEFLEAMKHAGYLEEGGKVPWWKSVANKIVIGEDATSKIQGSSCRQLVSTLKKVLRRQASRYLLETSALSSVVSLSTVVA